MSNAVKKTATIHKIRQAEVRAMDSGRTIRTVYYLNATKDHQTKVNRAKNAESAVRFALTHMRANDYDANVCEVWDESINQILVVISRDITGALSVADKYDFDTGLPIKQQPIKQKLKRMFPNLFIRDEDGSERNLEVDEYRQIYNALLPQ